jgi:DNA topoisomerase-1
LGARVQTESKNKEEGTDHRRVALPQVPEAIIRVGKFGAYVEAPHPQHHTTVKATFPEDMTPGELTQTNLNELLSKAQQGPTTLGEDPETGEQIYLRTGSYGPYLQLGEDPIEEEGKKKTKAKKPKRVSIPKTVPLNELDRAKALALLALPRLLGVHPTSGKEIRAGLGRFGPYIVHDGEFRSLKAEDDLFTVTLERALELLAMPKGTRGGGVSKPVGPHPKDKKPITLHSGKFGWYVKHGRTNATLPKDTKPEDVTVELAVALLAARKEKGK